MCGIPSIFVTLNISTFCVITLVVTFPMQLDSPDLEFIRESYCISGSAVSLLSGRSLRSSGPESPVLGFPRRVFFLFSPWWGPEYPAIGPESPPLVRSIRPLWPECFARAASSVCCSPPGGGRSFRPQGAGVSALDRSFRSLGPETPVWKWLQRLFFWEGYKYPSTFLQPAS